MKKNVTIILTLLIIVLMVFSCGMNPDDPSNDNNGDQDTKSDNIYSYGGSDPIGDFIEIVIDKVNNTVTHYNHTTGETNGPYNYIQSEEFNEYTGFSIIYMAIVDPDSAPGEVSYALFAEFENTAVVYQLFDSDNQTIGSPQYAIYREPISNSEVYGTAYNWMKFKIDPENPENSDMEAGFSAMDTEETGGLIYGAGYSNRCHMNGDDDNGIHDINMDDVVSLDDFIYDSTVISSYVDINGSGPEYRLVMTGTYTDSLILDFGPEIGGGSGLVFPQNDTKEWKTEYNGTYFVLCYEYTTESGEQTINPYKVVLSGTTTGYYKTYQIDANTVTDSPVSEGEFAAVSDLDASQSPGGTTAVTDQFSAVSGNQSAISAAVQNAHNCYGSFVSLTEDEYSYNSTFMMINPNGQFGGFTGFTDEKDSDNYRYRFGFVIKDNGYSNPE